MFFYSVHLIERGNVEAYCLFHIFNNYKFLDREEYSMHTYMCRKTHMIMYENK